MSDYYDYFPQAALRPKPKAGKERKKFGLTWWGEKWIDIVEGIGSNERMSRGRAYARAERAYNIDIKSGRLTANVEGSSGEEYDITITFNNFRSSDKERILKTIRGDNEILGKILNNQLPENFEKKAKTNIIPNNFEALCSCPDYENPCKHIATIFYVLSEEIDNAPQILFKLQGLDNIEILNFLNNNIKRPKKKNG